jgi:uncharacterized protein YjgD (DUF1641 family)
MARSIALLTPPRDPAAELRVRLDRASTEHAEALLAAYEVLQALHDRGTLEIVRGVLGAGDELLEMVVNAAKAPEGVRTIRNLLFWGHIVGSIEPEWFKGLFEAVPEGIAQANAESEKPAGLWQSWRRIRSEDSLRALAVAVDVLEAFGRHLHSLQSEALHNGHGASGNGASGNGRAV